MYRCLNFIHFSVKNEKLGIKIAGHDWMKKNSLLVCFASNWKFISGYVPD